MKPDAPLPPVFLADYGICLLEAFSLKEHRTPSRTVRGSSGFQTVLSSMKMKTLRLRLDGEMHGFVEDGGSVNYLPKGALTVPVSAEPPPAVVQVQMIGQWATGSDPAARVPLPSPSFEVVEPPRAMTIHHIKTKRELTLLLIDERSGQTIAVIGSKIHWNLDGLDVRFETTDGRALQA